MHGQSSQLLHRSCFLSRSFQGSCHLGYSLLRNLTKRQRQRDSRAVKAKLREDAIQESPSMQEASPIPFPSPDLRNRLSTVSLVLFCGVHVCQAMGYLQRVPSSLMLASLLSCYAWTKKSLNTSGLVAAWLVYSITHYSSVIVSAQLLVFFITSSKATEYKSLIKDNYVAENKKGGQRNWVQVMCNGGWPMLFALLFGQSVAFIQPGLISMAGLSTMSVFFFGCCLGSYACSCGDTWASEIGILSKLEPKLITTFQNVPRGTNGGISPLGLIASTLGGFIIGITTFIASLLTSLQHLTPQLVVSQLPLLFFGALGGAFGSIIDSLLGATLQYSGFDSNLKKVVNRPGVHVNRIAGIDVLSNNQVNLISSLCTGFFIGILTLSIR